MKYHIVTGGAGFIGSAFVWQLNNDCIDNILIVDNLGTSEKWKNLVNRKYCDYIHKNHFLDLLETGKIPAIDIISITHMGACSSTTQKDADYLYTNNFLYSKRLARFAFANKIRFIYASSAATYGDGSLGFSDDTSKIESLKPLNMYGYSKQLFDLWLLKNSLTDKCVGLKFFNVYGPNEYHKGDMSSVIYKSFGLVNTAKKISLFKSHNPAFEDGKQVRDFIYVKDVVAVMWNILNDSSINGIFNLGTGAERTWLDLAKSVFSAMNKPENINFIDMPEELKIKYQYYTKAQMNKLASMGLTVNFKNLDDGVKDYIKNYLLTSDPYL